VPGPASIHGDPAEPDGTYLDLAGLPPCITLQSLPKDDPALTLYSIRIAGAAPHPSAVLCGAALRRAGLVRGDAPWPAGCPAGSSGQQQQRPRAWEVLGLPGNAALIAAASVGPAAVEGRSATALAGFVSPLWAFRNLSGPGSGRFHMYNTTILVPDLEMLVMNEIIATSTTRVAISTEAEAALVALLWTGASTVVSRPS
jgi:hypothetical protein